MADHGFAAALSRAAQVVEAQGQVGPLLWTAGSLRCHGRQDGSDAVLTLVDARGPTLQYEAVGVSLEAL